MVVEETRLHHYKKMISKNDKVKTKIHTSLFKASDTIADQFPLHTYSTAVCGVDAIFLKGVVTLNTIVTLEGNNWKLKWAATWQIQQNELCAQQRLGSVWPSAQFDQSLCCLHKETLGPYLPTDAQWRLSSDWVDAQADLSLCWAHKSFFFGFVILRHK